LLEELSGRTLDVRRVDAAAGDMLRTSADVSRIRGEVGWEAQTPLRDGLSAMWSWAAATVAAG
jgi:UDP-glucose 4-epimerase